MASIYVYDPLGLDMTAEQLPESALDQNSIRIRSFTSERLEYSGTIDGYDFIASVTGINLDTNPNPYINSFNISDQSGDLRLGIFDFYHRYNDLNRMLNDGLDNSEFLSGSDEIFGDVGNDILTGFRGADDIWGDEGNDVIRAGNGADVIWGDYGNDILYGGFGKNIFQWEDDGAVDELYFKSDQWAYNYIYDSAGNNPNGAKADTIYSLDTFDKIFVQGVSTSDLSFAEVNGGIGIFAGGYLEATYTGGNLSTQQLQSMTSGVAA